MKVKKATGVGAALHKTKISLMLITIMLLNQVCMIPVAATIAANEIGDVITAGVGREEVIVRTIEEVEESNDERPAVMLSSRSDGLDNREPEIIIEESKPIVEESVVVEQPVIQEPVIEVIEEVVPEPEPIVEEIVVEEVIVEEPELEPDLEPYANVNNVTHASNATPEELNRAINSSCKWMSQYNTNGQLGEFYYKMEQQYGINAYFAISVSISEVGAQDASNLARTKNNIYGLRNNNGWLTFSSYEDCIQYWFNTISKYYVEKRGLISVQSISNRYCGGDQTWIKNVSNYMYKLPDRSLI